MLVFGSYFESLVAAVLEEHEVLDADVVVLGGFGSFGLGAEFLGWGFYGFAKN